MAKSERFGVGVGLLLLVAGCGTAVKTAKPVASAVSEADGQTGPQASVVALEDDPHAVRVASEIRKVTVYSDRALVPREGMVKVSTSPTVFAFRQLPGWVDEGSVRAATSAGRSS